MKLLQRHIYNVPPHANGGESLIVDTKFWDNGEFATTRKPYVTQEITLHSYCNFAMFSLHGNPLTPKILRELADQLEKVDLPKE